MEVPKTETQEETIQDIQNYLDTFNKDMRPSGEENAGQEGEEEQDELFGTDPEEERIFFTDENEDGEGNGVADDGNQEGTIDAPATTEYQTVVLPQGVDSGEMSYVLIVQPTENDEGHEDGDGENIGVYEFNEQEGDTQKTPVQSEEEEQEDKKGIVKVMRARISQANTPQHMCSYCSYSTPKRYLLARHLKSHSEERPHKCSVCERGFKTQASLQNHVNTHTGTKPHQCKYCEGSFTTSGELVRHIRYRHTLEKPHRCTECDYSSVELSKLKRHMRCHTGERPYQCPHCTYASPDTFKLKRHLRIHTGEKPYECDICLARFTQSNSLKSHKLIHTGNKPVFQCELCPTTCGRKTDLRIHVQKLHTSEKPVKCKRCSRSFPDRYSYKLHSKSHDGEKCFRCDLCPYASTTARHLESHMLVHTDQKPYNCEQCNQSFRQKQLLRRHVNLYHNPHYTPPTPATKLHQCPICLKQFRHKGNLLRHISCHETDEDGVAITPQKKFKVEVPEEVDELMALEGQDGQQYVVLEVIELQEGEEEEEEEEIEEEMEYEADEMEDTKTSGLFGDGTASQSDEHEEAVVGQDESSLSAITDFDSMLVPASRSAERRSLPVSADLSKDRDTCFGFDEDDE